VTAGDVERDHDTISDLQVAGLGANLLDDAHRLVAEDVTFAQERPENLVEMEVRAAQPG
jgi:hypothetical protein